MTEQENPQTKSAIILSIGPDGAIRHEIIGSLNEAEILGFGTYLSKLQSNVAHDAIYKGQETIHNAQMALLTAVGQVAEILEKKIVALKEEDESSFYKEEKEEEVEECGAESSSES